MASLITIEIMSKTDTRRNTVQLRHGGGFAIPDYYPINRTQFFNHLITATFQFKCTAIHSPFTFRSILDEAMACDDSFFVRSR